MPRLLCDLREPRKLYKLLRDTYPELTLERQKLATGDYITHGIVIERKTARDLIDSIYDHRFHSQIERLSSFKSPILLIEGGKHNLRHSGEESIFEGAILSAAINYGVSTLRSDNMEDTVSYLYKIASKFEGKQTLTHVLNKNKPRDMSPEERKRSMLEGIIHIGAVRSSKIVEENQGKTLIELLNGLAEGNIPINGTTARQKQEIKEFLNIK